MTTYTVKPGKKDFKPNTGQYRPRRASGFRMRFRLHENCWQKWGSVGHNQIWKIGGMTAAFSENNRRAALIGTRASQLEGSMMIYPYTNDKKKDWIVGNKAGSNPIGFLVAEVDTWVEVEVNIYEHDKGFFQAIGGMAAMGPVATQLFKAHTVRYCIKTQSASSVWEHPFDMPWYNLFRKVGGYYGGRIATTVTRSYDMELELFKS